jgi:predicted transcriptional regulator
MYNSVKDMDYYIYYRILRTVIQSGTILRSDLIEKTSLHSYRPSPIDYLVDNEFLRIASPESSKSKYYEITKKGLIIHDKMSVFFEMNDKLLKRLHVRLKIGVHRGEHNKNEIVLFPTTK